jgi:uncharacterized protein (DUF3084 family)
MWPIIDEIPEQPDPDYLFTRQEVVDIVSIMQDDGVVSTQAQFKTWMKLVRAIRMQLDEPDEYSKRAALDPDDPDAIPF